MADVSAAPMPFTIGGVEYLLSPLSDRDFDEITNWMRSEIIQIARQSFTSETTQAERDELLGAAMREARKLSMLSDDGVEMLRNVRGVGRLLYQSLKKRHKDITHDKACELLFAPEARDAFALIFKELNESGIVSPNGSAGSKKVPGHRPPRPKSTSSSPGATS